MNEKMLSLRLGRASTLRDQDITLSRPGLGRPGTSLSGELAPVWIHLASVQGRIYDDIYSSQAVLQPPQIRTSRARALATELETIMRNTQYTHVSLSLIPSY